MVMSSIGDGMCQLVCVSHCVSKVNRRSRKRILMRMKHKDGKLPFDNY
jgi:hypothetical protein